MVIWERVYWKFIKWTWRNGCPLVYRIGIKIRRQPWCAHCSATIRSIRAVSQCVTQIKHSPHRRRIAKIPTTLLECTSARKPIWSRSSAAAAPTKIIRLLIWHAQTMVNKFYSKLKKKKLNDERFWRFSNSFISHANAPRIECGRVRNRPARARTRIVGGSESAPGTYSTVVWLVSMTALEISNTHANFCHLQAIGHFWRPFWAVPKRFSIVLVY